MAIHNKDHALNAADHLGGTTAAANEVNVIGTNSSGNVAEVTVEEGGAATTTSKIVNRASDGHIRVPVTGQESYEVPSLGQVEDLISAGVWKAPAHSFVADHTASTVGDATPTGDQTTDPALAVNDIVVNTTDKKVYTVTSISGGTTGDLVTYDAGVLPTTAQVRIDKSTDGEWVYDTDGAVWIDKGASSHARQHAMTSGPDHSAGNWKVFHSNGSGGVAELALAAANAPLLSGGAAAAPVFGGMLIAPAVITAAGATPVNTDVSSWGNNTLGIVVGTGGRVFGAFKNATDVYYVELTAII